MTNEHTKADLTNILGEVKQQLRLVAEIQQVRADLRGTGSVLRNRVTVIVNADGTVIETRFGRGIEDLTHAEIAKAVTDAAQRAAQDLAARHRALMEPLQTQRARLPKLHELITDMPDIQMPVPPTPSLARPTAGDRSPSDEDAPPRYDDAEDYPAQPERRITDTSW